MREPTPHRRSLLSVVALLCMPSFPVTASPTVAKPTHPQRAWFLEAERMRKMAESWGDQSYGAVLVASNRVIGYGPSRVVKDNDADAHAERVAIREALQSESRSLVAGAVLYSTSRPCRLCEHAAAQAGVIRMYFGAELQDAGRPIAR